MARRRSLRPGWRDLSAPWVRCSDLSLGGFARCGARSLWKTARGMKGSGAQAYPAVLPAGKPQAPQPSWTCIYLMCDAQFGSGMRQLEVMSCSWALCEAHRRLHAMSREGGGKCVEGHVICICRQAISWRLTRREARGARYPSHGRMDRRGLPARALREAAGVVHR